MSATYSRIDSNKYQNSILSKLKRSGIKTKFRRFQEMRNMHVGKCNLLQKLFYLIDYSISFIIQGSSIKDYFAYAFYEKRIAGRNRYITYRRFLKILKTCNKRESISYLRDKSLFNQRYFKYLHRENYDFNTISEQEFVDFAQKQEDIFVKDVLGYRGNSVWFYHTPEIDLHSLYQKLKEEKDCHYIVEARLKQHESLASFHPNSANTIRIVTVYDDKRDKLHFMFAKLRMGNNGAHLDNTHAGGISGNIDIETGIINTPGYDVTTNQEYIFHPYTGKQIIGFQIPYWDDCKKFVEEVARVTPDVRYVGWDIVLLQDGTFALIEANDNADHDGQEIHYKGLWKEYKAILKQLK